MDWFAQMVHAQCPQETQAWFTTQLEQLSHAATEPVLYHAISLVGRNVGKQLLHLSAQQQHCIATHTNGWVPTDWRLLDAARLALLKAFLQGQTYQLNWLETLLATADTAELICFYQGLPLLPQTDFWTQQATQACRSNMSTVFAAVALHNPYPVTHFSDIAWQQMVLKSAHMTLPLSAINGLEARVDETLLRLLWAYVRERHSAKRAVSPELQAFLTPYQTRGKHENH